MPRVSSGWKLTWDNVGYSLYQTPQWSGNPRNAGSMAVKLLLIYQDLQLRLFFIQRSVQDSGHRRWTSLTRI
ncbi:hypothetical protein TRIATDRAFT_255870 [Trichoderma atroviride IMI 206040]|uniref:Uncharacterized protein n=1 Tax=Hypocrea atroviridis (strain ATCC 20476 / IMI 206040) TaxID=452589 RepID=G9NPC2_HYPAI|nr:uncharacterized protein TRIATDRAFT_255870 [Trichoderma atroviride IMI 206040]EHK47395.1 hypothetical protein TRIATDRAFT_255870 [Trichoderma atroviride IMI 206040]